MIIRILFTHALTHLFHGCVNILGKNIYASAKARDNIRNRVLSCESLVHYAVKNFKHRSVVLQYICVPLYLPYTLLSFLNINANVPDSGSKTSVLLQTTRFIFVDSNLIGRKDFHVTDTHKKVFQLWSFLIKWELIS